MNEILIKQTLPEISFSEWFLWNDRIHIANIGAPGVYLLAHFSIAPNGKANPNAKELIYIGETCDRTLRKRWNEFHRCAFEGKTGHTGGITYWSIFEGKQMEHLFVAAFPVDSDRLTEPLRSSFIRYIERKVLLDYALKWGIAPACNSK